MWNGLDISKTCCGSEGLGLQGLGLRAVEVTFARLGRFRVYGFTALATIISTAIDALCCCLLLSCSVATASGFVLLLFRVSG